MVRFPLMLPLIVKVILAGADMISSSGSSILDNAAANLVASSGGIENTTGSPVTIVVNVDYGYN